MTDAPSQDSRVRLGSREAFSKLQGAAYLNHAAISPASDMVAQVAAEVAGDFAARGMAAFSRWFDELASLRGRLAHFIGAASGDDIGFVPNTTSGVTTIALCFPWQMGDRVLLCEGEFPANVTPWQRAAELYGLSIDWLPRLGPQDDVEVWLQQLRRLLRGQDTPPPRLIALSAVQFQTGMRMPLERVGQLCREHGVQLFVDAIQACGAMPLDVKTQQIDYLACGCHKWLMALPGMAFLYIHPERISQLRPHTAGWVSHEEPFGFLFDGPGQLRYDRPIRVRADFVEGGITNLLGAAAWSAALAPLEQLGVAAIQAHIQRYHDALERGLMERSFRSMRAPDEAARSGILSVQPPIDVDVIALFKAIDAEVVSCSTPDGFLRFAPHWPNALDEVGVVLEAVDAALRSVRS